MRDTIIDMHPLCYNPIELHPGMLPRAKQCHHIAKIEDAPELFDEPSNLVPLCVACHTEVEKVRHIGPSAPVWDRWRAWVNEAFV